MAGFQRKSFRAPDERVSYPFGVTDEVHIGDMVVGRSIHHPGWRWSEHIRPIAGTPTCQIHHAGVVLGGRMSVRLDGGAQLTFEPDDVYDIPPGHDGWVEGDEPVELLEWAGVHGWASPAAGERVLATILFTDIVDSTARAADLGDRAWARLLEDHNRATRAALDRLRGREVTTTGDGIVAVFDGAERAIRAAASITDAVAALGLAIRAAVHTGEIELVPDNIRGVAVHIAARILALASPGEILVSETTRGLVESRELTFADRGEHELRGVTGLRRLFAVQRP